MSEEILENPVTGETMRVLESTPHAFKAQYSLAPHAEIPGEHFHPGKQQRISVVAGEMHVRINGEHHVIRSGETAIVPAGAPHFQWNPGDCEAVVVEEVFPAGRLHDFFKVLFGLARDGKTDASGYPSPLMAAALFSEFGESIQPTGRAARWMIAVLSPIAKALGYGRAFNRYLA